VLLLTGDALLDQYASEVFPETGDAVYSARNTDEALRFVCRLADRLNFAVLDFEDGCHGMTLLRAINACRKGLPILVITQGDSEHAAALAYANGAAACLARPFSQWTFAETVKQCRGIQPQRQLNYENA